MVGDRKSQCREAEQISKPHLSTDCTLQLGCMKQESLVIADQHAAVNTFPGPVHTARHTMGVRSAGSMSERSSKARRATEVKS